MSLQDRFIEQCTAEEVVSAIVDRLVEQPVSRTLVALNAIDPDIALGKQKVAQAITDKGVSTQPTQTLETMAANIKSIQQETYEIDGGEMYAKQLFGVANNDIVPGYWNLYDVLAQLLSDGRLIQYGGILLAEYYRGYDSLALSGAGAGGAYVVSDKDENGQFKMYTNDITHVWDTEFDGKGNRWVAYCFADEYHDFQITDTDTSPRSIFIGRKVGTITSLVNTLISQIVVPDGNELGKFDARGYSHNFGKMLVVRNLKNVGSKDFILTSATEIAHIECKTIVTTNDNAIKPQDGTSIIIKADSISCYNNKALVGMPNNATIPYLYIEADNIKGTLTACGSNGVYTTNLVIKAESLTPNGVYGSFYAYGYLKNVYFRYITNDKTKLVRLTGYYNSSISTVEMVDLQNGWCKPLDVSKATELSEDAMYVHILQRLKQDEPDCGDGVTITLGATNLAKLTSAESAQLLDDLTNIYGYTFA